MREEVFSKETFLIITDKGNNLTAAELSEEHFWLLTEVSPIHSQKVIYALKDFLVLGFNRREVCERYNVSYSYFSISLRRFSYVNRVVSLLASYYLDS